MLYQLYATPGQVQIQPKAGSHVYTGNTWQFGICEALQNSYETFRSYTKAFGSYTKIFGNVAIIVIYY